MEMGFAAKTAVSFVARNIECKSATLLPSPSEATVRNTLRNANNMMCECVCANAYSTQVLHVRLLVQRVFPFQRSASHGSPAARQLCLFFGFHLCVALERSHRVWMAGIFSAHHSYIYSAYKMMRTGFGCAAQNTQ